MSNEDVLPKKLPTIYQQYIHISRYSRYLRNENRRESWEETISRYFNFFDGHLKESHNLDLQSLEIRDRLKQAVLDLDVMPSMRCLMTAGEALRRDNMSGYNCAYLIVDHTKAFAEALHILMNGTGVGFSVERQYVKKLPEIPQQFDSSDEVIVIKDSRLGWATALNDVVNSLYSGKIPRWDSSGVRPAGSPLKTFGGRANGPAQLEECFEFIINVFRGAAGRRLTSIECHDIICKVGEIVVVGSVRRAALISLSNLSDDRMRTAKSGNWWESNPQRAISNNSACYTEKPGMGVFMAEWKALYDSKSGERGIFNRVAASKQASKYGRRDPNHQYGCNPCCVAGDTGITTSIGQIDVAVLAEKPLGSYQVLSYNHATGSVEYVTPTFCGKTRLNTPTVLVQFSDTETVAVTDDHMFYSATAGGYIQAKNLVLGDRVLRTNLYMNEKNECLISATTPLVEVEVVGYVEWNTMDTYDITVPGNSNFFASGILVHNSEILLRPNEVCNLSEVVVRAYDTEETLLKKVELATILGTFQSTLTDFKYVNKWWKRNGEEERLLGVSMTGIMDNKLTSTNGAELAGLLSRLREKAVEVNKEWAQRLGIAQSAAITTVKPSGSVSQLVDSASGIHARYSPYYIRTVRGDNLDPLCSLMKNMGFPYEPDVTRPNHMTVFSFPVKCPDGAVMRDDMSAIEQLEVWLTYQRHWCEHKPSITVFVKEHEWLEVGAWVYKNFDEVSGVAFLPHSDHIYKQPPYSPCSEEEYKEALSKMPKDVDWSLLSTLENYDMTVGSQELACSSSTGCDL